MIGHKNVKPRNGTYPEHAVKKIEAGCLDIVNFHAPHFDAP